MDTSSFKSFPDLPAELRLQVWEEACHEACREREATHPGIQYTTVRQSSPTRILLVHQPVHLDRKARSGTMRDGGLWLACKESRDVIRGHCPKGPGGEGKVLAGDEWSYCVDPGNDIFCIQDPEKIKHDDVNSALHVSIWAVPRINDCCHIKNIALEFDPSWIKWFPRTYKNVSAENTPRGFLARLLRSQYINDSRQTTVWLIDNDMTWARRPSSYYGTAPMPDYNKRFINCHESYVEAYPSNTCHYCSDKRSLAIRTFLSSLNVRGEHFETQHPNFVPDYDEYIDGYWTAPFEVAENIRVLALACNEVEFCRKDHRQDRSTWRRCV